MSKKKKGLNLDTQKISNWCKSNIVLVILIAVCIGAIVGLPQLGAGWTEEVVDALKDRSRNFSKIESLSKTNVTPPGSSESTPVAVNQALVDEYAAVASSLRGDAEKVVEQAMAMNKKDYVVLFSEGDDSLFPFADTSALETLPQQFHRQLEAGYRQLLAMANAGSPMSKEDLVTYLEDSRVRFMENNLSMKQDSRLTVEQRDSLQKHLSKVRMARLRTNAEDVSVYVEESALGIPQFDINNPPEKNDVLFAWQWRYWVVADVLSAIEALNEGQSVLTSPVKRVISLKVSGMPGMEDEFEEDKEEGDRGGSAGGSGGGSGNGGRGGIGGGGRGGIGGGRGGTGGGSRGSQSSNSFTGRTSGSMYDIINIQLSCIVDTERIPIILDGISSHNFFTVVDLDLHPADKFEAFAEGYDYGPASISELTLELESVWFRSWTTEFMPNGIKEILGIKVNDN